MGGGDAVRRRLERQVTVDRRLESRVDAYATLLTGARRHKPLVYSSSVGWPVGPPTMPCAYGDVQYYGINFSTTKNSSVGYLPEFLPELIQYKGVCIRATDDRLSARGFTPLFSLITSCNHGKQVWRRVTCQRHPNGSLRHPTDCLIAKHGLLLGLGTTTTGSSLVHCKLHWVPARAALRLGSDARL